jgi:hypothetical protein
MKTFLLSFGILFLVGCAGRNWDVSRGQQYKKSSELCQSFGHVLNTPGYRECLSRQVNIYMSQNEARRRRDQEEFARGLRYLHKSGTSQSCTTTMIGETAYTNCY